MKIIKTITCAFTILYFLMAVSACTAESGDLEAGFVNPPGSAGVNCFWWWLNSNVTKEAITRDLEEMGTGGIRAAWACSDYGKKHP